VDPASNRRAHRRHVGPLSRADRFGARAGARTVRQASAWSGAGPVPRDRGSLRLPRRDQPSPRAARTIATIPARTAAGSALQASTTAARSVSATAGSARSFST